MKKVIISSLAALALLAGCAHTDTKQEAQTMQTQNLKTIEFFGEMDKSYKATLKSNDDFMTAKFMDSKGNKHDLKTMPSGSGLLLGNEKGVNVHFSKGEGIITLGKDKEEIFVSYDQNKM